MRVARFERRGQIRAGVVEGDSVRPLPEGTDVVDLLTAAPERRAEIATAARGAESAVRLADVRLIAPVQPPTIRDFSVFEQHIEGMVRTHRDDATVPDTWYASPFCYFSNTHAVNGPGDEIEIPPGCRALDLELKVAAVIGRAGRDLTVTEAGAHIAGYTIFNDWSARDLGADELRLGLGMCKAKDFANTLGPWVVTADELEPYRSGDRLDLDMRAAVNGVELGDDTLANMAWSFAELVAYASRGTWVRPGDVLGSGTCGSGCLAELWGRRGREDPPPLRAGDTVTLTVEGIGELTNTVVAGVAPVALPRARPGRHSDHTQTLGDMKAMFGAEPEDLPDGKGLGAEFLRLTTHAGTHVDAPWHYFPTCGGERAKTVDELPLADFFAPGVVLDLRGHAPGARVDAAEVRRAVDATGAPLSPGDIVCCMFGHDEHFGTALYWDDYAGLGADAVRWLIAAGVRVIGTDAPGLDRGNPYVAREFARTGDRSLLWEAHRVGIDHEYVQIEKLANLASLPPRGFWVSCFPVKIKGASGGWCRAVAILGLEGDGPR
ncbi:MAG: fumarylacetoacetate hydrolase family protein [Streptosporangiaceae bacterium]